jgi:NAD(P)H-flavin reductase
MIQPDLHGAIPQPLSAMRTWLPKAARIVRITEENFNTKTFSLDFTDDATRRAYQFAPGQFNMVYVPKIGEAAISVSSDPGEVQHIDHTIRLVGTVTRAIGRMKIGDIVGLRGPFGNGWPMHELEGRDVVIMAGGIGLAPLRPVIYRLLAQRKKYGRIVLLYGCRTQQDRVYSRELDAWENEASMDVLVTVDNATEDWSGPVGVVTNLMRRVKVNGEQTIVLVCGPRILNRVAAWSFLQLHVPAPQVYVSLERNMNCGFGRCGHCQYGPKFVCIDGPVFRFSDLAAHFAKEEV